MKKILMLDTSVATINLGDEIIKKSIERNFYEIYEKNYIYNLPTHTKSFSRLQQILYKKRMHIYYEADAKFLCGTNALYTNMLRPMPTWNINVFNYHLYRNTILLGVGLGVNSKKANWYTKILYKKVLSNKYIHSVRDEKTKKFVESLGFKAINTGCPTLWGLTKEHCNQIPISKSEVCLFTLTYYNANPELDYKMIEIIKNNYKKILFWPQCIDDLNYLKSLVDIKNITIVSPNVYNYEKILKEKRVDYIGNRLHGGIFAMQHGVRSIIISIDYRAEEMSKNYGFKCIERTKIPFKLDTLINSEWKTEITGLDFNKINDWKRQFI